MNTKNSLDNIRSQFNSEKRANEMLVSYDLKPNDDSTVRDPYEKLRESFVFETVRRLMDQGTGTLLDVGCGVGGFVARCLECGIAAYGIDCAERMISLAQETLKRAGFPENRVALADFFDYQSELPVRAITAIGVIWYYEDKLKFLRKAHSLLEPGGCAAVIHRNSLFNLFALNEGTSRFLQDELLQHLPTKELESIVSELVTEVPGLSAPIQKHTSSALHKSYENPLTIAALYSEAGFRIREICYVYIHPVPPRLRRDYPAELIEQIQSRYGRSWQGMFLGSQFLVVAEKL